MNESKGMHVWTWQGEGWDITDGSKKVDHSRGPYSESTSDILPLYDVLHEKLGTDQVVYCCMQGHPHDWNLQSDQPVLWKLTVPDGGELAAIDNQVWNCLLKDRHNQSYWDELFVTPQPGADVEVLLKYPVPTQWVIGTYPFPTDVHLLTVFDPWSTKPDDRGLSHRAEVRRRNQLASKVHSARVDSPRD